MRGRRRKHKKRHIHERRPVHGKPLGRHVNHDPRSRAYAYAAPQGGYVSAKHARHVPVLAQGSLGSCTGHACLGAIGSSGLFDALPEALRPPTDVDAATALAIALYSRATQLDDLSEEYPPTDTGSNGLSVAKAAKERGFISGYLHAFSLDAALKALQEQPVILGINWDAGFDSPDATGLVQLTGDVRGGHEIVLDEIDADREVVWFTNSWGPDWGIGGRACMSFKTLGKLLAKEGDATILLPLSQPAPQPTPIVDPPWWHVLTRPFRWLKRQLVG